MTSHNPKLKRLILNAFYDDQHQQLVIHWIDILDENNPQDAEVVIQTYPADNVVAAKTIIAQILKSNPQPPAYKDCPYGLAVREIARLQQCLNHPDLPINDALDISLRMARYTVVASRWEHDRKN